MFLSYISCNIISFHSSCKETRKSTAKKTGLLMKRGFGGHSLELEAKHHICSASSASPSTTVLLFCRIRLAVEKSVGRSSMFQLRIFTDPSVGTLILLCSELLHASQNLLSLLHFLPIIQSIYQTLKTEIWVFPKIPISWISDYEIKLLSK